MTQVVETNMENGIDLIHNWDTVRKALKSGRFDYWVESEAPYSDDEEWFNEKKSYYGLETIKSIDKNVGLTAFFKGSGWRVIRSSPQFGITLFVYEQLK